MCDYFRDYMKCANSPATPCRRSFGRSRRGSALVIILSALVLVCIIVLLFMSRSLLNRQISFTSAGQYRAENLGVTAIDTIVGDLKSEIAAGSTKSVSDGIAIYQPTTNFTAVPLRVGDGGFANVVKRSAGGVAFWSGGNYASSISSPVRAAAGNSTINASANGRLIKAAKWNDPYLLGTNLPAGFVPPDWIVVTRSGAITNAAQMPSMADLSNPASTNRSFAIGRFAYMIYDEGGLLDVNVAGFPSTVSDDFKKRRGTLPQVDLAKIPGIANASALVEWRNVATFNAYADKVLSSTNGFLTVAQGDQTFVSRQDLIKYVQQHTNQISLEALPYLATFTRELNAPSYTPAATRPRVSSEYFASGQDDLFNPSLINTRVTTPFLLPRRDGTQAEVGEPLIKSRFPLSALGGLTSTATAAADSSIERYFGLTRSSANSPWVYRNGADRILKLSEVSDLGREPDFFELLLAGIKVGSLGQSIGAAITDDVEFDRNFYYQIAQIAANIIDQYDEDSWPTQISFNGEIFSGIENLPYLSRVEETPYRRSANNSGIGSVPNGYSEYVEAWFRPEFWNPHAQANVLPSPVLGPTEFRFITEGSASLQLFDVEAGDYVLRASSGINNFGSANGITFSNGSIFSQPTRIDRAPNVLAIGSDNMVDGAKHIVGTWVGSAHAPDCRIFSWQNDPLFYKRALIVSHPYVQHKLQYRRGGDWVTYDVIKNVESGASTAENGTRLFEIPIDPSPYGVRVDPTTDRFGLSGSADMYANPNTLRPGPEAGRETWGISHDTGWTFGGSYSGVPSMYPGLLAENKTTSASRYQDPDGVVRGADGVYAKGLVMENGGYPLATDNLTSRPWILNRPFRSVAELGYASRGMPWKRLDFFTGTTGDAALLDLFCLTEPPSSSLSAGRLNLNTRQAPVLQAVISGAMKAEDDGSALADADAQTLAANLIGITTQLSKGPLLNRSDLASRWVGNSSELPVSDIDSIVKRRREAPVRALSDIGNLRTWNLLVDVTVQSGKYAVGAAGLDKFVVEGERRYWLHLALDRYTGKIIDQYLEAVSE